MKRLVPALLAMCAVLALAPITMAAAPTTMPYQGKVTDAAGTPRNGTFNITFRIFTAASGGTQLYTETINSVTVVNGLFSVEIGNTTPIPSTVFDGSKRFLEIEFAADGPMTPRQVLSSVPYAFSAGSSAGVAAVRGTVTGSLADGTGNFVSRVVSLPGPGVVVVTAEVPFEVNHSNGTSDNIQLGISQTINVVESGYNRFVFFSSVLPTGATDDIATIQRVYNVGAAGNQTYFLNYNKTSGSFFRYQQTMVIQYFPTTVGAVTGEPAGIQEFRSPQTAAEREAAGQ